MTTGMSALKTGVAVEGIGGTLPAQIHALLEQAIIDGVLEPGSRLSADQIAAQYGVSRIPVREALRSLHEAGWVDIRPRLGVYVRERSERELVQLFEARAAIEGAIADWAALRRTSAQLTALEKVVDSSRKAARRRDIRALSALSSDFYAALRAAAGNDVLAVVSADLEKRAKFYFSMVAGDLGADWVTTHHDIAALVRSGESDKAAALVHQHILDTGRAVAQLLSDG